MDLLIRNLIGSQPTFGLNRALEFLGHEDDSLSEHLVHDADLAEGHLCLLFVRFIP